MYEYKTISFGCAFSSKNTINKKIQDTLDKYSKQGWKLHTIQVSGGQGICVCVFEREKEEL